MFTKFKLYRMSNTQKIAQCFKGYQEGVEFNIFGDTQREESLKLKTASELSAFEINLCL